MQVRHQSVDHDRHGDRREHKRANHRRHRSKPVAEREVDECECGEDAEPDHQCELVLARRRDPRIVATSAGHLDSLPISDGRTAASPFETVRTSSSTRSALMEIAAADPSPAAVITCARGLATFPAAQTPATLVLPTSLTRTK